jgi:hypothetical protein
MNLLWVAAIAAFVHVEKVVPPGELVTQASDVLALTSGACPLLQALLSTGLVPAPPRARSPSPRFCYAL